MFTGLGRRGSLTVVEQFRSLVKFPHFEGLRGRVVGKNKSGGEDLVPTKTKIQQQNGLMLLDTGQSLFSKMRLPRWKTQVETKGCNRRA